jgi:spore coat polysaccharide biosynthesis protein SpsF (cytidylyltransferase family)
MEAARWGGSDIKIWLKSGPNLNLFSQIRSNYLLDLYCKPLCRVNALSSRKPAVDASIPLIVQARVQSTRFPGKIVQPFAKGQALLEFQLCRLKAAFPDSPIVVATSDSGADDVVAKMAEGVGVLVYRGEEQDVLTRFVDCCFYFSFTGYVVRVCGDNPFLQTGLLTLLLEEAASSGGAYDYISFSVGGVPAIRTHFGFFCEVVAVDALKRVAEVIPGAVFREHVTNYIYEGSGSFKVRWLEFDQLTPYLDSLRLTVDSREDMENALYVYEQLSIVAGQDGPSWEEIVRFVEGEAATRGRMERQIRLYQK